MSCPINYYTVQCIVRNFTGDLRFGVITEPNTAVLVYLEKAGGAKMKYSTTSDGVGLIQINIPEEEVFFSEQDCCFQVSVVRADNYEPIQWTDGSDNFDYFCLCFLPYDCDFVEAVEARELIIQDSFVFTTP